jgi:hypothetical protein
MNILGKAIGAICNAWAWPVAAIIYGVQKVKNRNSKMTVIDFWFGPRFWETWTVECVCGNVFDVCSKDSLEAHCKKCGLREHVHDMKEEREIQND